MLSKLKKIFHKKFRNDVTTEFSNGSMTVSCGGDITINGKLISANAKKIKERSKIITQEMPDLIYSGINLSAPAEINYNVSHIHSLKITAPENCLNILKVKVEKGSLIIDLKSNIQLASPIKIVASGPDLSIVEVSGSGDAIISNISNKFIKLIVSGSGDITAKGVTSQLLAKVSGSGDIDASELLSEDIDISVSGSGDIKAVATKSATGKVSGSGDAIISGRPEIRTIKTSGDGDVKYKKK